MIATNSIQTFAHPGHMADGSPFKPSLNRHTVEQLLAEISRPEFDPKYIFARFGQELEPLAVQIISSEKRDRWALWDFEQKIKELIRSDSSQTYQSHLAKFVLSSHYRYDQSTELYESGLSSVWENVHSHSLYGFPNFLGTLNNQFEFNSVIYKLVTSYAPNTIAIHESIGSKYYGYTFHCLTKEQMGMITKETYGIYCRVQQFLQSLNQDQINWINLIDSIQSGGGFRGTTFRIYDNCVQTYFQVYKSDPPSIDFNLVWKD